MEKKQVAFALGGLAGSNAWGTGFLHAALEHKEEVRPALISCTSGQIYWVYQYLRALSGAPLDSATDLRDLLQKQIKETEHHPLPQFMPLIGGAESQDIDYMELCVKGVPNKFHVPWLANITEVFFNLSASMPDAIMRALKNRQMFLIKELMRVWPSDFLKPDFPETLYQDIAATFNSSDVGVFFNSYNPQTGEECVYLNEAAKSVFAGAGKTLTIYRHRTVSADIDKDAVKNALWLIFYGAPVNQTPIDAAYYRHIMLRELVPAKTIFVVRPVCYHWHGGLPHRLLDMLDFLTQAYFNGIYAGEREQIVTMNELRKKLPAVEKSYHHIDLVEIEPDDPALERGFFDYVFEEIELFDSAHKVAKKSIENFLKTP